MDVYHGFSPVLLPPFFLHTLPTSYSFPDFHPRRTSMVKTHIFILARQQLSISIVFTALHSNVELLEFHHHQPIPKPEPI